MCDYITMSLKYNFFKNENAQSLNKDQINQMCYFMQNTEHHT